MFRQHAKRQCFLPLALMILSGCISVELHEGPSSSQATTFDDGELISPESMDTAAEESGTIEVWEEEDIEAQYDDCITACQWSAECQDLELYDLDQEFCMQQCDKAAESYFGEEVEISESTELVAWMDCVMASEGECSVLSMCMNSGEEP